MDETDDTGDSGRAPSLFGDAFSPRPWTLADSTLHGFVDPETMKTIDFDGTAAPETPPWQIQGDDTTGDQNLPPQPGGDGFYTGLSSYQPGDGTGQGNGVSQSQPPSFPSTLEYDGATHQLTLNRGDGAVLTFPANNNVASDAQGHWPDGTYLYGYHKSHSNDGPDSSFGTYGIYVFNVPGFEGIGVHSGRVNTPDGLGGTGVDHVTEGCIRTTDDGVAAIGEANASGYPVTNITVHNNSQDK